MTDIRHIALPPGAVTGIGSLPFRNPHTAVQFVARTCPRLPFWPELPQRVPDERSVEQVCGPIADLLRPRAIGSGYDVLPGHLPTLLERLTQATVQLDPACSAGFFAFEHALAAGQFPHAVAIKGQLVGPLTLGWQLWDTGTPLVASPLGLAALQHYITRLARWQINRLAYGGKPVLLFLDEPCLALVPPGDITSTNLIPVLRAVLAELRGPEVLVGVHTCATLPQGITTVVCTFQEFMNACVWCMS